MPTAVLVHDDVMSDYVLASCQCRGIRVPEDLSIVSLVDANPNGHRLPLTGPDTVSQLMLMMKLAVDKLMDQVEGRPVAESQVDIPVNLVMKASTGPATKR